jgi:hypothetical protein
VALAIGILQGIAEIQTVSVLVTSTTDITVGILPAIGELGSPALSTGSVVGLGGFSGVVGMYAVSANIDSLLEIATLSGTAAVLSVDAALGVISILGVANGTATIREVATSMSVEEIVSALVGAGAVFGPDVVIDWIQVLNLFQGQGGLSNARASVVVIPASEVYFAKTRQREYEATERERGYVAAMRQREYGAGKRERDFTATARKRDYYDA